MIIGLTGFKGSGKTVVADYLVKEHGFVLINFKLAIIQEIKDKFPDLLKELSQAYHMTEDKLFTNKPEALRALMCDYGTNIVRAKDPDYWVKKWMKSVSGVEDNIVVDDVRFFNELSTLTDRGGVLIRVKRGDITEGGTHATETEQNKFISDFTITAIKGDHAGVYEQVEKIIGEIKSNVD